MPRELGQCRSPGELLGGRPPAPPSAPLLSHLPTSSSLPSTLHPLILHLPLPLQAPPLASSPRSSSPFSTPSSWKPPGSVALHRHPPSWLGVEGCSRSVCAASESCQNADSLGLRVGGEPEFLGRSDPSHRAGVEATARQFAFGGMGSREEAGFLGAGEGGVGFHTPSPSLSAGQAAGRSPLPAPIPGGRGEPGSRLWRRRGGGRGGAGHFPQHLLPPPQAIAVPWRPGAP